MCSVSPNDLQSGLTPADLTRFVEAHGLDAQLLRLDVPTPTVQAAASALGVEPQQIIKSVLFLADEAPVLVISCGLERIDRRRLADVLGISRRRIKIAGSEQVLAITGYPAGAVPPFGHHTRLKTLVDAAVKDRVVVYGGGGDTNALLRLPVTSLMAVTQGEIVSGLAVPEVTLDSHE
jgi:prolyl-tRNA editing enzyme YbaK/EbsC (Cys-tRNA(Pro) deacylase)